MPATVPPARLCRIRLSPVGTAAAQLHHCAADTREHTSPHQVKGFVRRRSRSPRTRNRLTRGEERPENEHTELIQLKEGFARRRSASPRTRNRLTRGEERPENEHTE